jgi:hypothetical protein
MGVAMERLGHLLGLDRWAEDGRPQGARPQDPPAEGRRLILCK